MLEPVRCLQQASREECGPNARNRVEQLNKAPQTPCFKSGIVNLQIVQASLY
jgi:hypothetical protein